MNNIICLDKSYSTTRQVTKEVPVIEEQPDDKFETVLFLPEGEGRLGEGGLRTQGYFKASLKDKPLITVITVVFNGEQFLEETILSVINQTYDNVEYIIVDGGSYDGTLDIIKKHEHAIDYWVSEKDCGIYDAMNKGVDLCLGEYLIFIGGDDVINQNVLIKILSNNSREKYDLIFGDIIFKNNVFFKSRLNFRTYFVNTVHHQGAFYHKPLFNNFRYSLEYKIASDYELNLLIYMNKRKKLLKLDIIVATCGVEGVSTVDIYNCVKEMNKISRKYATFFIAFIQNIYIGMRKLKIIS